MRSLVPGSLPLCCMGGPVNNPGSRITGMHGAAPLLDFRGSIILHAYIPHQYNQHHKSNVISRNTRPKPIKSISSLEDWRNKLSNDHLKKRRKEIECIRGTNRRATRGAETASWRPGEVRSPRDWGKARGRERGGGQHHRRHRQAKAGAKSWIGLSWGFAFSLSCRGVRELLAATVTFVPITSREWKVS